MKLKTIAEKYNYICYWCKKKYELQDLSRDHIVPVRKSYRGGGKGGLNNTLLSCKCCNLERGTISFLGFQRIKFRREK